MDERMHRSWGPPTSQNFPCHAMGFRGGPNVRRKFLRVGVMVMVIVTKMKALATYGWIFLVMDFENFGKN